jgi:hypothetical protein
MARKAVRELTPEDAAYLAGLIDGEGTITLTRRHSNERRQLVLSISSTERALVEWSLTSIGVGKITRKVRRIDAAQRQVHQRAMRRASAFRG